MPMLRRTRLGPAPVVRGRIERGLGLALAVVGALAIAYLTLRPGQGEDALPFLCLTCGDRPLVDLVLNVLLFVPLGVGLGLHGVPFGRALVAGGLATFAIELLQFSIVPGRDAGLRDLLTNTAGAALGHLAGARWRTMMVPAPRAAGRVATGASIVWLLTQAVTAWALYPALPDTPWWARLQPPYHDEARFKRTFLGRIDSVQVGSVLMRHSDQIGESDAARASMLAGAPLKVAATRVPPTEGLAPIVVVTAGPVYDAASLMQEGRDVVFESAVRGTLVGLRTPAIRLPDAIPPASDEPLLLEGSYAGGRWQIRALHGGVTRVRTLAASASMGWAFLIRAPGYAIGPEVHLVTALWIGAIWVLLGYWHARAAQRASWPVTAGTLAATAVLGLAGVPVLVGLPASHWSEWAAAAAGLAGGMLVAATVNRLRPMHVGPLAWVPPERVGRTRHRRERR